MSRPPAATADQIESPFLVRHEFVIRRLHSLTGLIPVGAYMVVHLATNASVLNGPATFQDNVYRIHSLGGLLPIVEWGLIFLPILFHAVIGVVIIAGGLPNHSQYRFGANWRYTLQRWTGMIAFAFILWHVFHMHGWIHADWWLNRARDLGGAQFRPFSAASTTGLALQNAVVVGLYAVGVLASVYHLANGVWTMGITWGAWTTPQAQSRALKVCAVLGIGVAAIGLGDLGGMWRVGHGEQLEQAIEAEDRMYNHRVEAALIAPDEHKRASAESADSE